MVVIPIVACGIFPEEILVALLLGMTVVRPAICLAPTGRAGLNHRLFRQNRL